MRKSLKNVQTIQKELILFVPTMLKNIVSQDQNYVQELMEEPLMDGIITIINARKMEISMVLCVPLHPWKFKMGQN